MSLFSTPEEHAANPPESWRVERFRPAGSRPPVWFLTTSDGTRLSSVQSTRKAVERDRDYFAELWRAEGRWYAGETPRGQRSWAECKAEQERTHAFNVVRCLMRVTA